MGLVDKLPGLIEDKSPEVLRKGLGKAKELADEHLNGPERDLAKNAIDKIANKSDQLAHLGVSGVLGLVTQFHLGDKEKARLSYLAEVATFEERIAAAQESNREAVRARINRQRAWEDVREVLTDIGQIALKVIPLLLMAA